MSPLRTPPSLLPVLLGAAVFLTTGAPHAADDASVNLARRAATVAHVGPSAITVAELEDRLAPIPAFQLRTWGNTGLEIARGFLDQVIARDALLALGARDAHVDQDPAVKQQVLRTISGSTLRNVRQQLGLASAVPMNEVQQYYDANRARYDSKERISVWRILSTSLDDAQSVLDAARKEPTVANFTQLARDRSLDKATSMRGGNLGFIGDDGASNEPGIKVDPGVVAAARAAKDGEIVPTVVPEGTWFAVVWRRGTVPGQHFSVMDVAPQIREILWHQKAEAAEEALIDRLRAEKVKNVNELLLGTFDVPVVDGTLKPHQRPVPRPQH